jgi:hypothetical protein
LPKSAVYLVSIISAAISISLGVYKLFHTGISAEDFYIWLFMVFAIPIALLAFLISQVKEGSIGNFFIIIFSVVIVLIAVNFYQDKTIDWWVFVMVPMMQIAAFLITYLLVFLVDIAESD